MTDSRQRLPVWFVPHGAGPWPFIPLPNAWGTPQSWEALADWLRAIPAESGARPQAILVVSAHWDDPAVPTVASSPRPGMFYDYGGFPENTYRLSYPAPGAPELAARVQALLADAGIASNADPARGYDHGVFVPLMVAFPEADIPVLAMSLRRDLDPQAHLAIGRALAPLREDGVLIVGSGMSYHNMYAYRSATRDNRDNAQAFDRWLTETVEQGDIDERDRRLSQWTRAPGALDAHRPGHEHLTPLFVIAGAAGSDVGQRSFHGDLIGMPTSGYRFG